MKYEANIGMEDSPVFWKATFNTIEEARAYKRGFRLALEKLKPMNYDVYWCQVRAKK